MSDHRSSSQTSGMSPPQSSDGISVCVVGATGAVGKCMIQCLADLDIPVRRLGLYASKRSAGTILPTAWGDLKVQEFSLSSVIKGGYTVALLAVSGTFAQEVAPQLAEAGVVVVDNSSAFRYDDAVPLVIPEINPQAMLTDSEACSGTITSVSAVHDGMLIANPNCTTAIAAMVLWPLHKAFRIRRMIMSTWSLEGLPSAEQEAASCRYQAASGAGDAGLEELEAQLRDYGSKPIQSAAFPHQLLGNVIPRIDSVQSNGYTKEEMKVAWETRKVLNQPDILISCTAVRVATMRAHAEAITLEFDKVVDVDTISEVLKAAAMVVVKDDPQNDVYPTPLNCTGKWEVSVGRIRESLAFPPGKGIDLFVCGDQLLRGAALNAVWWNVSSAPAAA